MTMFDFVAGEGFRSSLESDYRELNVAMEAGAWKAVHILAGSIIEAILIDYLVASNYKNTPRNDLLKLDLDKAISACKQENVLSEKAASLATVVRLYRNLIHPGRIERLGEKVDENGAKIAQALVAIVVDEISQRSQEKFGYTAEQIVTKLENDPLATAILGHLLKETKLSEIERLLLDVLPDRSFYLERMTDLPTDTTKAFKSCFRLALTSASNETKGKVARNYVKLLKEESADKVRAYEMMFFNASDLDFFSGDDRELVKQHLWSILGAEFSTPSLLEMLQGLGQFVTINHDDIYGVLIPLIRQLVWDPDLPEDVVMSDKDILAFLGNLFREMPSNVLDMSSKLLGAWVKVYKSNKQDNLAQATEKVKELVEWLIPPF